MTLRELIHKVGFQADTKGLDETDAAFERINKQLKVMSQSATHMLDRMEKIGKAATMKLTLPIMALSTVSVMARIKQEESQQQWSVFLGGMDKGKKMFEDLRELSDKTQFKPEQVDEYGKALYRLHIKGKDIVPMIQRFADIAAGTGINADAFMEQYAQAQMNPILRGRILKQMMREVGEDKLKAAGINPRMMAKMGTNEMLGMGSFDKIVNQLALANMGKAADLADTLGKNTERFWTSLTKIREAIGGLIEKVFHLNAIFKGGAKFLTWMANVIEKMPGWLKLVVGGLAALLAILGPMALGLVAIGRAMLFVKMSMYGLALAGFISKGGSIITMLPKLAAGLKLIAFSFSLISKAILAATWEALPFIVTMLAAYKLYMRFKHEREIEKDVATGKRFRFHTQATSPLSDATNASITSKKISDIDRQDFSFSSPEQRRAQQAKLLASFSGSDKGGNVSAVLNVNVTAPAGSTPQQVAALKAGAEAAHGPILESLSKYMVLSIYKAHR